VRAEILHCLQSAVCHLPTVNFLPLIEAKRDGRKLSIEQIKEIILAFTAGAIPDYQMAAFLMAIYFRGLDSAETSALTLAMRDSGDVLRLPKDPRPLADKHSTGGVGDKVSLPLAPLLAALGFRVPMISGRGLGITGGTLDKLDSIPGFQTKLGTDRITEIVQSIGCVICGQTERMVPADKNLYALRDVTGTVPSIPLIVASILSKKLAENLDALLLDVKFGAAAFMPSLEKARELAQAMVKLGNECGVKTGALLTRMDAPLGSACGNWLEVKETVACLENRGGAAIDDLKELVLACAARLLLQTQRASSYEQGRADAEKRLRSGAPREKFLEMIAAQGADLDAFHKKLALEHTAGTVLEFRAGQDGFVSRCDARVIGEIVRDLGGGRLTKESKINYDVGVEVLARRGTQVRKGALVARVHSGDSATGQAALARLGGAFEFATSAPAVEPLIVEVI
jgi:pyrimidine-nucleoside phosphorylase